MAHVNRRIGKSSETAGSTADGTGGGVLDAFIHEYFQRSGNVPSSPGVLGGIEATGGIISDYTVSGTTYRAHVFTSSGTFTVSEIGTLGNTVDYLVVGGGGAGGNAHGSNATGGGGAGGLRTNMPACPYAQAAYPISTAAPYTVIVGGGGVCDVEPGYSRAGTHSEIYPTPGASGSGIYASGGGAGSTSTFTPDPEASGGSGGGEDTYDPGNLIGSTVASPDSRSPTTQGFAGGSATPSPYIGGGGGGAGEAGNTDGQGYGGDGLQILIAEPPATPAPTRTVGADGGYFAGGGGGNHGPSSSPGTSKPGGLGGGGGNSNPGGGRGTYATGGGGGGSFSATPGDKLGQGGSGIVVIRYKIAETLTAKATGGVVSFYGGKTIHTFTSSGTFNVTSGPFTAEMMIVAGGASGGAAQGSWSGAGGGAGGVVYHPGISVADGPYAVTVGGGGASVALPPSTYSPGKQGSNSSVSLPTTYTASGGGYGGGGPNPPSSGNNGGSGGGGTYTGTGGNSQQPASNPGATEYGYAGGDGGDRGAGGGGGAGGAGENGGPGNPVSPAGYGGTGIQLPTTFRDPASTVGAPGPSGSYWIAGGGGGGGKNSAGGTGGGPGGPYAGGGSGGGPPQPQKSGYNGVQNTGGGGGGLGGVDGQNPATDKLSGAGGSGIVLIAYPT